MPKRDIDRILIFPPRESPVIIAASDAGRREAWKNDEHNIQVRVTKRRARGNRDRRTTRASWRREKTRADKKVPFFRKCMLTFYRRMANSAADIKAGALAFAEAVRPFKRDGGHAQNRTIARRPARARCMYIARRNVTHAALTTALDGHRNCYHYFYHLSSS